MTTALAAPATTVTAAGDSEMGGLSGLVLQLIDALGEWGVALPGRRHDGLEVRAGRDPCLQAGRRARPAGRCQAAHLARRPACTARELPVDAVRGTDLAPHHQVQAVLHAAEATPHRLGGGGELRVVVEERGGTREQVADAAGDPSLDPLGDRDGVVDLPGTVDDRRHAEGGGEELRRLGALDQPADDVLHAVPRLFGRGEVGVDLLHAGELLAAQVGPEPDDAVQPEVDAEHGPGPGVGAEALRPAARLVRRGDRLGFGDPALGHQVGERRLDRGTGESDRAAQLGDRVRGVVAEELVEDRPRVDDAEHPRSAADDAARGR